MNRKFIAAAIAAGSLLALQAPALAQLGSTSFALPNIQHPAAGSYYNDAGAPAYYNYYAGPVAPVPPAGMMHHRRHR